MAVPKRKKSKSKRDSRRANHDKYTLPNASLCKKCGEPLIPHRVCSKCGWYNGKSYAKVSAVEEEAKTKNTKDKA